MKEHIKIHSSILKVEDLKKPIEIFENSSQRMQVKLKSSQRNEFKLKAKGEDKQEILEPGVEKEGVKDFMSQTYESIKGK